MTPRNGLLLLSLLLLSACASVVRNPLPRDLHLQATVLDGEQVYRYWGDGSDESINPQGAWLREGPARLGGIMHRAHHYLILSGGGANGAYGAGILKAWTEMGTRPEFVLVTGISTGALIAPFAFLGSRYDAVMEEMYTTLDSSSLIADRSFWKIIGGDAVVDTTPLSRLLENVLTDELIQALAREYARGRTLLVGTTNLDAVRPVVWNITRMAASGHPEAPNLIRKVLLASASIPGAFPPVYIPVQAPDRKTYDEMHVDGGATSQMFFYPASIDWKKIEELLDVQGTPDLYVIRNAWIEPRYEIVEPRLLPIAGRTIDSLIRTQGKGDFYRMWALAERDDIEVHATWIPDEAREELRVEPSEAFDPKYMRALFEYGYRRTLEGKTWFDAPHIRQIGQQYLGEEK